MPDLSKRRFDPEDVAACEDRFNKAKAVHGVLRHLAERRKYVLEDLYARIAWPLYKKYKHAFDAFKLALAEEAGGSGTGGEDPLDVDTSGGGSPRSQSRSALTSRSRASPRRASTPSARRSSPGSTSGRS